MASERHWNWDRMRLVRRANDEINETNPKRKPKTRAKYAKIFTLPTAVATTPPTTPYFTTPPLGSLAAVHIENAANRLAMINIFAK